MIEFGSALRAAREAKGYTVRQIEEQTHIMSSIVTGLENEDFSMIAAPIYGRGFVKIYCEVLGLDPKPYVTEFMEIYNGNREPVIRERAPAAAEPPAVEPPPVAPEPPTPEQPAADLFDSVSQGTVPTAPEVTVPTVPVGSVPVAPAGSVPVTPVGSVPTGHVGSVPTDEEPLPEPEPVDAPQPPAPPSDLFEFARNPQAAVPPPAANLPNEDAPALSRYASPFHDDTRSSERSYRPPRAYGRLVFIAVAALLVICGLLFGIRALYRATTAPASEAPDAADLRPAPVAVPSAPATQPKKASSPSQEGASAKKGGKAAPKGKKSAASRTREPLAVPSLYID